MSRADMSALECRQAAHKRAGSRQYCLGNRQAQTRQGWHTDSERTLTWTSVGSAVGMVVTWMQFVFMEYEFFNTCNPRPAMFTA